MLPAPAVSIASAYWASHLGCAEAELFSERLRVVPHGADLADYWGVFALFRSGATLVSAPKARLDLIRECLATLPLPLTPNELIASLSKVAVKVVGPAMVAYAQEVPLPLHAVRDVEESDSPALNQLQQSCTPEEWEHGGSSIKRGCSGVFLDQQLVATAGCEMWGSSVAHISVVTHPEFRGRGFGRSAVAHVARSAIDDGLLPQYRALESNGASIRLAESLGFRRYATSVAVRLQ